MVVERIKKAVMGRWSIISEDQVVRSANVRPDLVLKKNNDILILDITVPFENGLEVLTEARRLKEEKYAA